MFETVFWLVTADAQDVLVDGIAQRGFGVCLGRGDGDIVKGGSN